MTRLAIISPGDMERLLKYLGFEEKDNWEATCSLNTPMAGVQPFPFIRVKIWGEV